RWKIPEVDSRLQGFELQGEKVEFVFDPARYRMDSQSVQRVQVAGTFNAWNAEDGNLRLEPQEDGTWRVSAFYQNLTHANTAEHLMFKFVVNGEWKNPPEDAPNAMLEPGTPHQNLSLPLDGGARPELIVQTAEPIDLSAPPLLTLTGAWESALHLTPSPGAILDTLFADKAMGVTLDRENQQTHYRLFAPRATEVVLGFFDGPYYVTEDGEAVPPVQTFPLKKSDDGVWEHTQPGLNIGQYYAYQVHGMVGNGEGFQPGIWLGDPYATAVALAEGNSIVMDLEASPVRPQPKPRIAWEDMIVYETHVRHLTQDPSSGVPEALRGKYKGILASEGTGTGLDHLKALGVNVIQLMPIHEFNNGFGDRHDWGYATCFFFAPESSYATRPLEGSQVKEFRELVDGLHSRGFAVFLDVVYNHIGGVNVFNQIDRKYYFRLNPDFTNQNFSGCGNDVASERPMMRKLIKESVLFWVEEYGIDGFRFDLAELIDDRTLLEIEHEIRQKHPHVVLHSEPWSFRGSHKDFLGPTTWGAWNDRFREPAKAFVVGNGNPEQVKQAIRGSVENWTRHPLQSVNYMESHDDNSLVDELTLNPGMDGRILSERDEKIHKLAATLIFGSLGTPMITEGQAFLRSKHGVRNTYNRGDKLNSLRWEERERPHAKEVLNYYRQMIAFRQSEAGRALRVKDAPSLEYTRFLETGNSNALGWILNATRERPGVPMVMILMNTDVVPVNFEVDLPRGTWRQIGDGQQVDGFGIPGFQFIPGGKKFEVTVPPQTALLYRSGMP
ncbi:MAG: alpha-amylase family glycosyl hydrolase, partial [Kiritimatiellia bacterium]